MKRKLSSSSSIRMSKFQFDSRKVDSVEKRLGLLKSIGSFSINKGQDSSSTNAKSKTRRESNTLEKEEEDSSSRNSQKFTDIPDDLVLRKSVTIESNFDLRQFVKLWKKKQNEVNNSGNLWLFDAAANITKNDSGHVVYNSKSKNIQGDMLWLEQSRNRPNDMAWTGTEDREAGNYSHRNAVIHWQEALECIAKQFYNDETPTFYVLGSRSSTFSAVFFRTAPSRDDSYVNKSTSSTTYDCLVQRCTAGLYEDLRRIGVPMTIIGSPGSVGDFDWSTVEPTMHSSNRNREKLNIFGGNMRINRYTSTDRMLHFKGIYNHLVI